MITSVSYFVLGFVACLLFLAVGFLLVVASVLPHCPECGREWPRRLIEGRRNGCPECRAEEQQRPEALDRRMRNEG